MPLPLSGCGCAAQLGIGYELAHDTVEVEARIKAEPVTADDLAVAETLRPRLAPLFGTDESYYDDWAEELDRKERFGSGFWSKVSGGMATTAEAEAWKRLRIAEAARDWARDETGQPWEVVDLEYPEGTYVENIHVDTSTGGTQKYKRNEFLRISLVDGDTGEEAVVEYHRYDRPVAWFAFEE